MPLALALLIAATALWTLPVGFVPILGGAIALLLICWQPWLGLSLLFAAQVLCTEDILLRTEDLRPTIYYDSLPYFHGNIFELMILLLAGAMLVRYRLRIVRSRMDIPILALAVMTVIGYLTGGYNSGNWTRIYEPRRMVHFFAAYFLFTNLIDNRRKFDTFLLIFLAATGLKGIHGMWLYAHGEGLMVKWRIRAIFTGWGDGLNFTTYLLIMAAAWFRRIRLPGQLLWWLLSFPVVFSFLMSYKRSFYIGLVAGIGVLFLLFDGDARRRLLTYSAIAAFLGLALIIATGNWYAFSSRVASIFQPKKESSANYRIVEWKNALIAIRMNPWLGIGMGGILTMIIFLSRTNLLGIHNTYLWAAAKMGFGGLLCVCWFLLSLAALALRDRKNSDAQTKFRAEIFLAVLTAICCVGVFAPLFHQTRTSFWLGIFAGIVSIAGEKRILPDHVAATSK